MSGPLINVGYMNAKKPPAKRPTKKTPKIRALIKKKKNAHSQDDVNIVAVGASAGCVEAFEKFFTRMPADSGLAFVVIAHLDSNHKSLMPELISRYSKMKVHKIKNEMRVKADTIYVIPPNNNVLIKNKLLYLEAQRKPHFIDQPFDHFLGSLALEKESKSMAVILTGNGNDGTQGIKQIKEAGGLVFAQDPATAQSDDMPNNALESGMVDYVLSVEKIPAAIMKSLKHYHSSDILPTFHQIFLLLRQQTGHDFSGYKLNTIQRRIERQMLIHECHTIDSYLGFLQKNPENIDNLFNDLLIGVTSFFRDPKAFQSLKKHILMSLKSKDHHYSYRVWIPGCSTGEEAYTISIILHECVEETKYKGSIQIFATDIDVNALKKARIGLYPKTIESSLPRDALQKFFTKDKNFYKAKNEIRKYIVFGVQNIILDPPFTKLDLISCRNLLIYLNGELQKKIFPILHYSLKPKSLLFLGTSEASGGYNDLFRLIDKKWKIYERKDSRSFQQALINYSTNKPSNYDFKFSQSLRTIIEEKSEIAQGVSNILLNKYITAAIVVNAAGNIYYTYGKVNFYLKLTNLQKAEKNIFDVSPPALKTKLKTCIQNAGSKNKEVTNNNITIKKYNSKSIINIKVIPLKEMIPDQKLFCIIFENAILPEQIMEKLSKYPDLKKMAKKLVLLEGELEYTQENLQTTIEEHQSSNEELQSTNEELQSTNEEIETSKEELLSLNEELVSVNTELQAQIDQLVSMNDDMNNLMHSTEIMALFLDNDLKIKRYTPRMLELISLMPRDIGRHYYHFVNSIQHDHLTSDIKDVIKTLVPKTFEVKSTKGKWYQVTIMPYRTLANLIDGAVIIFFETSEHRDCIDKLKQTNQELQTSISNFESIFEAVHLPIIILDNKLTINRVNTSFLKFFPVTGTNFIDKQFDQVMHGLWNIPSLLKKLKQVIKTNLILTDFEVKPNLSKQKNSILVTANKFVQKNHENMILLTMRQA